MITSLQVMAQISLPPFEGVADMFDSLIGSSLFSNYIYWFLGIGLVTFLLGALIKNLRG